MEKEDVEEWEERYYPESFLVHLTPFQRTRLKEEMEQKTEDQGGAPKLLSTHFFLLES